MSHRFPSEWPSVRGPELLRGRIDGQSRDFTDIGSLPARLYVRHEEDFVGAPQVVEFSIPIFSQTDNAAVVPDSVDDARGYAFAPVTGLLVGAQFVGENGLAKSDANFVTFTLTNLGNGQDDQEMLEDSDANGTTTTGTAITALTPFTLLINQDPDTNAPRRIAAGDVLRAMVTVDGTLPNTIAGPVMRVQIQTMPAGCRYTPLAPVASWTGVSVYDGPLADTANGIVEMALGDNDVAATAGLTWDDQLLIQGNKGPIFQCYARIGELGAEERVVLGLASAYNATLDSATYNLWFRCDGDNDVVIEGDDNVTNTDDKPTGFTLDVDTWYWFTINASDPANVTFWIDEQMVGSVSVSAIGSAALQPVILLQKDGDVNAPTVQVDRCDVAWRRL